MSDTENSQISLNPYKEEEYLSFIKTVENGEIPEHWELLADALGVTRRTIATWKKMPEFKKAIQKGIDRSLREMERVGKKDWKMWRERYAMLAKEKQQAQVIQQFNTDGGNIEVKIINYGDTTTT